MRSNEQAPTFHTRLSEELWPDRPSPDISFEIDEGNGSSGPSVGALSPERLSAISLEARRGGSSKLPTASTVQPTVIVVDDDPGMRESISGLIPSVGFQVKTLASVDEFRQPAAPKVHRASYSTFDCLGKAGLNFNVSLLRAALTSDSFHYRPWRHPHDCPGNERRSDRVPDQALQRPGSSGGSLNRSRTRPGSARRREVDDRVASAV